MKLKTFIKWIGNKSKHLKHILPHIPKDYNTYIEPFVGSGSMFLKLQPDNWIINDINKDIINVWNNIKDNPEYIIEVFKEYGKIFKPMNNKDKLKYCRMLIKILEDMEYDLSRAILYMLLKFSSYMGNIVSRNQFYFEGIDMRIYIKNDYPFLKQTYYDNLFNVNKFLNKNKGKILNLDYKNVLKYAKKDDFVFLDPPYIDDHDYIFNYNIEEDLNKTFVEELIKEVKKLDNKGVKWLMTQTDTKYIRNKFKKYEIYEYPVYRKYQNKYASELIIKNF